MSEENMTPPTGKTSKPTKAPKPGSADSAQEATPEKAEGEKKPRAPRVDYGYRPDATIVLTQKENKYRGQRKDWFDSIVPYNGKQVQEWEATRKGLKNGQGTVEPPRGWIRFFVQDGTVKLEGGTDPAPAAKPKPKPKAEKEEAQKAAS